MYTVFLTRKFPPHVGGMETFSAQLTRCFPDDHTTITAGKRRMDILWAAPLLLWKALLLRKKTSVYHLGDAVLVPLAPFLRLFARKPIVVTVHGLELTYHRFGVLYRWLMASCLPSVDAFVAVSHYTVKLLHQWQIPLERIHLIPHGVVPQPSGDRQGARRQICEKLKLGEDDCSKRFLILTVGRLVRRKGVSWFIESVLSSIQHLNPLYLVVSDGPERSAIEKLIAEQHLSSAVRLLGQVDHETLTELYHGADVFVMPNIPVTHDVEGFGFVALEAAATGLPVLAADLEGIPDAIHHQRNGILFPPQDAHSCSEQLIRWHHDPESRKTFGEQAQAYTMKHFQWEDVAARYRDLFLTLVPQ